MLLYVLINNNFSNIIQLSLQHHGREYINVDVFLGKRSKLLANVELAVTVCIAVEVHVKYRPIVVVICISR